MLGGIRPVHYPQILKMNSEFVRWLSPLDEQRLIWLLKRAKYARQVDSAKGVLIGYPHNVDYPDHKNLNWISQHLDSYFYIDRIIIDAAAQGQGIGYQLYSDIENYARKLGFKHLACEVNTKPNNPSSHKFHLRFGFEVLGDADYPKFDVSLRYYAKEL